MTGGSTSTPHGEQPNCEQPHDEHGDPICPRCGQGIAPGQPVLFLDRRMRHADCRFAPKIVRDAPDTTVRTCVVCRKPITRGVPRYRRAEGDVHVECDERGTERAQSA
ncbi:MAG: hypothetical protein HYU51_13680 [Candidatus Rokubacteria bacterium]|nr:hypothetical protein [Candidatus Rokubacteria bacterium]